MVEKLGWKEIGARKQKELQDKIPQEWKIKTPPADMYNVIEYGLSHLSNGERQIVEGTATEAIENLRSGKWTSVQVTSAVCHAAAIAHQTTNCLTVIMFEEALARAKEVDDQFVKTKTPVGPLHGLPISIKDCFSVEGYDSTIGYIAYTNQPASREDESVVTRRLRAAGAVLYCKTNIPMAMSSGESWNNVYGETVNPYNTRLTPGGSSGGEGALVAARGSLLGIGTDIAGSVRIPSAFCGLYSMKPSFGRFPQYGSKPSLPGQEAIFSNNGPMARSLDDVKLYAEWMVGSEPWLEDPKVIPIPWRTITLPEKLTFAIVRTDGYNNLLPPVQRGLEIVEKKVREAGHEVIDFDYTSAYKEAIEVATVLFSADGSTTLKQLVAEGNEPMPPEYEVRFVKTKDLPTSEVWKWNVKRNKFQKRFLDWWVATAAKTKTGRSIDGIISAVNPFPACLRGNYQSLAYTCAINVLDYPAVTFPVTFADINDKADPDYIPIGPYDAKAWETCKFLLTLL